MKTRLALAAVWPLAMAVAQQTGELRIEARDPSGSPVAADVKVEPLPSGSRLVLRADPGGHASASLPPGRYRVEVSKEGFAARASVAEIAEGKSVTVTVVLAVGPSAFAVDVISATPLAGLNLPLAEIAGPVQTATQAAIESSGALDLTDFLNRRLSGVHINEIQGNPVQPDVNYRGYTASPLLGTPQGVSVYMDGMRLNQAFGDTVSWDLIPRVAISEVAMIPGSNPLFGLNTLGGALTMRTKDGLGQPGFAAQLSGGSFGRKTADLEYGGHTGAGFHWYSAANLFFEDGWRQSSPSNVRQFFGKLGRTTERASVGVTLGYANNSLIGNALQEQRLLALDRTSVYTKPDITAHRAPMAIVNARRALTPDLSISLNGYFRYIRTRTSSGDINDDSLDQSVYQPGAAERAALAAAGFTGFPASGASAANTPFPFWRCIANVLLRDEPAEKCNGLLNRTASHQRNFGVSGQVTRTGRAGGVRNQFTAGAGHDGNRVGFAQSSELGYLTPDRSVVPLGAFGDGVTGGDADGEPFDVRADLSGRIHTGSVYATDTLSAARWSLTMSGRYNRTSIDNRDLIRPLAGTGSLTGKHRFGRFNPGVGLTLLPSSPLSFYASYSEGSRAPTAIELGCADPEAPCRLPNALAGDPPLRQVVARTVEAGVRGNGEGPFRWSAGWFRASNRDDLLFVASEQTGFGYFRNFGSTRRQGAEFDASIRWKRLTGGAGYTYLRATFESPEEVSGTGNSSNVAARRGLPGQDSFIFIDPGARIPLVPSHLVKAYLDARVTGRFAVDLGLVGISSSLARGNENGGHQPDGTYYLGRGSSDGYAVVNLGARYRLDRRAELFAQVTNLLDRRYSTGAQLGPTGFTANGTFIARPFPVASNGEYPVLQSAFFAPGAPRGAWAGIRLRF